MTCRFSLEALRRELTPLDNRFITDYLPDADGTALKVYLFGLMQCHHASMQDISIADALGIEESAVVSAFSYWQDQHLVRILSEDPLVVEYQDFGSVAPAAAAPAKYAALVARINSLTAPRQFGMRELQHVYDWIEVYGIEEGAIPELIGHCMDLKGRRVSINYISAVAQSWADQGIITLEAAQSFIQDSRLNSSGATKILRSWNKKRKPTQDELTLYTKWTKEWGFSEEAIMAMLPRITVTGSANFVYLDEQLDLERRKGNTDTEAIRREDEKEDSVRAFSRILFERAGIHKPATHIQCAQIGTFLNDYAMSPELLLLAAELCSTANEPFGAIKRKLGAWHAAGVTTIEQARRAEEQQPLPQKPARRGSAFMANDISQQDLDSLLEQFKEEI